MKKLVALTTLVTLWANPVAAENGDTKVAKWKYNARGAFTMSFDDSMNTHANTAMPAVIERGLIGTWFINPGKSRHRDNRTVWEMDGPKSGQEYANHTWEHKGAGSYREADFQIGETARYIWNLRDPKSSKLMAFARGGATTWNISRSQMNALAEKYYCIRRTSEMSARTDKGVDGYQLVKKVQESIREARWVAIHFHGIGGDWLPIDTNSFFQLVDYLAENKDRVWSAGWIAAYQYIKERDSARIDLLERPGSRIRILLTTGLNSALYAEPLTLITEVPASWSNVTVTQGGQSKTYHSRNGKLQYEAFPERGEIVLQPTGK